MMAELNPMFREKWELEYKVMSKTTLNFGLFGLSVFRRKDQEASFSNEWFSLRRQLSVELSMKIFELVVLDFHENENLDLSIFIFYCFFSLPRTKSKGKTKTVKDQR